MSSMAWAQDLTFVVPGGKQGKIKVGMSSIENNEFSLLLQVEWFDSNMKPTEDRTSQIVFNKENVKIPGNDNLICKSFEESKTSVFFFNASLILKFTINEELEINKTGLNIDIPFHFAADIQSAADTKTWKKFLARSPRNFMTKVTINPKDIRDLTPPQISVLSPDGVMDGFRPQVFGSNLEVKVEVRDRNPISEVAINDVNAIKLNDSVYIANIQISRIGGTLPIKTKATDSYGNVGAYEFFIESKHADENAARMLAEKDKGEMVSDVDTLIPEIGMEYENRYALIIGNEDYKSHQTGLNYESNVEFARRDAETFKQYAIKTLGIKESNIIFMLDAKAVEMHRGVNQLTSLLKATQGEGEAVVFFAGHGFPNEKTKEAYLIPVDVSGNDLEFGIKLKEMYAKLNENPSKGVTVFLDACFSGGGRAERLLAARAIRVKPKENAIDGKMVVLSASGGNESALPYRNKFHGMFTYYLLKSLQDSEGDISLG